MLRIRQGPALAGVVVQGSVNPAPVISWWAVGGNTLQTDLDRMTRFRLLDRWDGVIGNLAASISEENIATRSWCPL